MFGHDGDVATFDEAEHGFPFESDTFDLVELVGGPFIQTLGKAFELLLSDAVTVIDDVKSFSSVIEKSDLDLFGVHVERVLKKLGDPEPELLIEVLDLDI